MSPLLNMRSLTSKHYCRLSCCYSIATCPTLLTAYAKPFESLALLVQCLLLGQEFISHVFMVQSWLVFSPMVSKIEFASAPEEAELFSSLAISKPVEVYVHCCGLFGLDFAVYCSLGC